MRFRLQSKPLNMRPSSVPSQEGCLAVGASGKVYVATPTRDWTPVPGVAIGPGIPVVAPCQVSKCHGHHTPTPSDAKSP